MHFIKRMFCFCLFFSAFAVFAETTAPTTTTNSQKYPATLNLGGTTWKLDNEQDDSDVHLGEYVTGGENVNNWNQLVTFQRFKFAFPKEVTPAKFAEGEISQLKKQGYKPTFKLIASDPNEAIMEFKIDQPKNEQQDELQRIIRTPDDQLIVLHYVIRKPDMGETDRTKWIAALKSIHLPASTPTQAR